MTDAGADALPDDRLVTVDLPLGPKHQGKVRDFWIVGDRRVIVTTDRQSAFDRVLGAVPYKGQVLTRMAAWWFERTRDIVPNHLVAMPDPNVLVVEDARVWPVEMVIRGYITGVTDTALWSSYARGARELYGLRFPDGLRKNQRLPEPVITPTTKAYGGGHDEMITRDEIVARGIVPPDVYAAMEDATRRLFARGQAVAAERGLILVDTKYEFGLVKGELTVIDELHTPDSSRFWVASEYEARFARGEAQKMLDKENIRQWLIQERGFSGHGAPPPIPDEVRVELAGKYLSAYEQITGTAFDLQVGDVTERLRGNLKKAGLI